MILPGAVGGQSPHVSAMKDEHCPRCGGHCKWIDDNSWYRCHGCMLSFKFSADHRNDGYVSYDSKLREKRKTNLSRLPMTGARAYRGKFPKLARIGFWLAIRLELLCHVLFRLNADRFTADWTITADTVNRHKEPTECRHSPTKASTPSPDVSHGLMASKGRSPGLSSRAS